MVKKKENYVQPHISNRSVSNIVDMDVGRKKNSERANLPLLKKINNDSEMKDMISKLSYSLIKMKNSHTASKYTNRKNNVSIIKQVMRSKQKHGESYHFKDYSENITQSYDFSIHSNPSHLPHARNKSSEIPSSSTSYPLQAPTSPVRKALHYFLTQKSKGHTPIDYTKYFWVNNHKYINKFTSL
mmetsp:Transcript_3315/g.3041  ORF Transcript_3315/g.3041 Transcript_3315/m.3041 type:complete len:185 (-) Transcript_3315:13-567(-)